MKMNYAATLGLLAVLPGAHASTGWTGEIKSNQNRVEVGQTPDVAWTVSYPTPIDNLVDVVDDEIVTKTKVKLEVRVLGAAWGTAESFYRVQGEFHDGNSWNSILDGFHQNVDATEVVYSGEVESGTTLNLKARGSGSSGKKGGNWYDWRNSSTSTEYIQTLVDGDPAPQLKAGNSLQQNVEDYLSPYLSKDTGNIDIGPRDVIYLVDFNSVDSSGFDLQDIAVLVTFSDPTTTTAPAPVDPSGSTGNGHTNNGHGNNVDGVDSSNPGNSKPGQDSDPTVDDEKKSGSGGKDKGKWWEEEDDD